MGRTDMSPAELAAFLDEPRLAAVGGKLPDGSPGVVPAAFVRDGGELLLAPIWPRAGETRELSAAEATVFLQEYCYSVPPGSHPFVAASTLRKDRRPFVVPFGFLYEDGDFYLTINNARSLNARLRHDSRIALGIFGSGLPEQIVIAHGIAEIAEGAESISRRIFERQMRVYTWLDFDSYLANWLAAGRTTYRLRPSSLLAWTAAGRPAEVELDTSSLDLTASFVAMYNEHFPTRVALLEGDPRAASELSAALAERFSDRYGDGAAALAQRAQQAGRLLRLTPSRVQSWDTKKQPEERVTRGIDPDGRHVERGSWGAASAISPQHPS